MNTKLEKVVFTVVMVTAVCAIIGIIVTIPDVAVSEVYSSKCERLPGSPTSEFMVYEYVHDGRKFMVFITNGMMDDCISVVEITEKP